MELLPFVLDFVSSLFVISLFKVFLSFKFESSTLNIAYDLARNIGLSEYISIYAILMILITYNTTYNKDCWFLNDLKEISWRAFTLIVHTCIILPLTLTKPCLCPLRVLWIRSYDLIRSYEHIKFAVRKYVHLNSDLQIGSSFLTTEMTIAICWMNQLLGIPM